MRRRDAITIKDEIFCNVKFDYKKGKHEDTTTIKCDRMVVRVEPKGKSFRIYYLFLFDKFKKFKDKSLVMRFNVRTGCYALIIEFGKVNNVFVDGVTDLLQYHTRLINKRKLDENIESNMRGFKELSKKNKFNNY